MASEVLDLAGNASQLCELCACALSSEELRSLAREYGLATSAGGASATAPPLLAHGGRGSGRPVQRIRAALAQALHAQLTRAPSRGSIRSYFSAAAAAVTDTGKGTGKGRGKLDGGGDGDGGGGGGGGGSMLARGVLRSCGHCIRLSPRCVRLLQKVELLFFLDSARVPAIAVTTGSGTGGGGADSSTAATAGASSSGASSVFVLQRLGHVKFAPYVPAAFQPTHSHGLCSRYAAVIFVVSDTHTGI